MRSAGNAKGNSKDPLGILSHLIKKGVVLWVDNGALRYRAPKGLVTAAEMDSLLRARSAIALLLDRDPRSLEQSRETGEAVQRQAPLSFTQLAHWKLRMLGGGRPIRAIASATQLKGKLAARLLEDAVREIVRRHDSLRTHVVLRDGVPMQEIALEEEHAFEAIDLEFVPASERHAAVQSHIENAIVDVQDYAIDPLFRAVLLRFGEMDHVLILAMDHIISDGYSLSLIPAEIWTAYAQRVKGEPIALPDIGMQFAEYATRQRALSRAFLDTLHAQRRRLNRTRFPADPPGSSEDDYSWGLIRFRIDAGLVSELREWVRARKTTLVLTVFTAYAAAVLRQCGVRETVIQFMTGGRMGAEVHRTVGYFAFPLFIKITLCDHDSFVDLLRTVTAEYCTAFDEADFGFAYTQSPRPEFTRSSCFNWLPSPHGGEATHWEGHDHGIRYSRVEFPLPKLVAVGVDLDCEPSIVLSEREEGIFCELHFPRCRFSVSMIELFAKRVVGSIAALVRSPELHIAELELP